MSETKSRYSTVDNTILDSLLEIMTPEQILSMGADLRDLKAAGHGYLIITVKNGEVCYIDKQTSRDVRRSRIGNPPNS